MKQIATKTDTIDTCPANAFNSLSDENQNAVTKSGQTLDATSETTPDPNPTQLARAITKAALEARAYSDSGAANAYVLTAVGSWQQPTAYVNGLTVEFIGANANTGASTVNVAGLGVKNITTVTGAVINADSIGPDKISRIRFDSSGDRFLLEPVGGGSSGTGTGSFNYIANPDAETDATTGIGSQATTGSWAHTKSIVTSELAEPTSKLTVHKISGSGLTVGDYREFQAVGTINDADGGRVGRGEIKVKDISGTVSGEYKVQAYNKTTSQYIGQSQTIISDGTYVFDVPLSSENDIVIHLIALTASPTNIGVSGVGLFFEAAQTGPADTQWAPYTPVFTGLGTVTVNDFNYRIRGQNVEVEGQVVTGTVPGSIEIQMTLPLNGTVDYSNNSFAVAMPVGTVEENVSGSLKRAVVLATDADTFVNFTRNTDGGTANMLLPSNNSFGSTTRYAIRFTVPLVELRNNYFLTVTEASYQNARASAYRNTSVQALTGSTYNNIIWNALESTLTTQGLSINTSTGNFTPVVDMWVDIHFSLSLSASVSWLAALRQSTTVLRTVESNIAMNRVFGTISYKLVGGTEYNFSFNPSAGVNLNNSQTTSWIDIKRDADRSGSGAGFPTTEKINTVKQALVPITNESGEGDLGAITNWASPGTKKYKWVRLGNEVRFYWYVSSTGGSPSTSASSLLFDLPAGTPTPTDHLSNDASGEFPVPCSGAASSNNFVKNELENNAGTYRIVASFSTNTAATSWSGMASWIILPTS